MTATLSVLAAFILSMGNPMSQGWVVLKDGRSIPAWIGSGALESGDTAVAFSPELKDGAFWRFGDTFQRVIYYSCSQQQQPVWSEQQLSCPAGSTPVLRPDVTLPSNPKQMHTSHVPPIIPGGRAVVQSAHVFAPWIAPCAIAFILLIILARWLGRRADKQTWARAGPSLPLWTPHAFKAAIGLTALGALLRFWGLGSQPFEQNEFTYFVSGMGHNSLMDVLLDVNALAQTHPPLLHVLLYMLKPFGNSEFIARLPAALAGIASVPLVFALGWRLSSGRLVAASTAGLFAALSHVSIAYSQDVSPYTFTLLFSCISLLSFDGIMRDPSQRKPWWGLTVATWGLTYTHYYGLHMSIALGCVLLWQLTLTEVNRRAITYRALGFAAVVAAGVVPWIPAFVQGYLWSHGHSTAYQRLVGIYHPDANHWLDILEAIRLTVGVPHTWQWLPLMALVPVLFLVRRIRLLSWQWAMLVAPAVWFLAFELINRQSFLKDMYGGFYFGIRYMLYLFPLFWVAAALFLSGALEDGVPKIVKFPVLAIAVAAVLGAGSATYAHLSHPQKPDVRGAVAHIQDQMKEGDALIVGPAVFYHPPLQYYWASSEARESLNINDYMQTPRWHKKGWLGVLSDLSEPFERSLKNPFVRRVWLLEHTQHLFGRYEFSQLPSQRIRELVSTSFTENKALAHSVHDVNILAFERTVPRVEQSSRIHFGWNDGPYIRGFQPPGAYASPGRRVRPNSQLWVHVPKGKSVVGLTLRAGTMPPGGHQVVDSDAPTQAQLGLRMDGKTLATLQLSQRFDNHQIRFPPLSKSTILNFDLQRPRDARRPPEVVLDLLTVEYGSEVMLSMFK